ncbi:MAG: hypothetical protein H6824_01165 [Planctomycetaceae bacterium]|nr:hypothetical protein [Planctomycetaceae bacterium]
MPLITSNAGELELLDKLLKDPLTTNEDYVLKLFQNDYTPDQTTVEASLTEANFTNYAAVTLTRSGWSDAVTVSNKAESSYATQSWTCGTTGNSVYGYYVTGSTSGTVLWAERFAATRTLVSSDVLNLQPKFTLNSEN